MGLRIRLKLYPIRLKSLWGLGLALRNWISPRVESHVELLNASKKG